MDRISRKHRSWNMSRIQGRNTKPELAVRSLLHRMGYRFSLHRKELSGKPDIVLPKYKTVIFVHGCFWHRHPRCKYAYTPKTRRSFWLRKFQDNIARDRKSMQALKATGWKVIVVWECQLKKQSVLVQRLHLRIEENSRVSDTFREGHQPRRLSWVN